MEVLIFLANLMFVLLGVNTATVSAVCQTDTCQNYGVCYENYLGIATCSCLQRFYGSRCEKVKRTYAAQLEIASLKRGDSTWSKEYIKSMLKVADSEISVLVKRMTVILLNGALSSKIDYLGSRIIVEQNQEPVALIELHSSSNLTAVEVQVLLLDHLKAQEFLVKINEQNMTIEMKTESVVVSDHDECDQTAIESCGVNAVCVNTIGSFQCRCKKGNVQDGHVCKASSTAAEGSKVDWNRIFIWGGIVLVVLFWMLIVGVCVRKRLGKKPTEKLGHRLSTLSRRSTEPAGIPEIKITETQSIYNGSSRRPSSVFMNKALELDSISIRSSSLERCPGRQIDLQKRNSVATSEYGSSSPYLDSASNDGRFSDAQSISSADSDLTMPQYPGEPPLSSQLPRRSSDLAPSSTYGDEGDSFDSPRKLSFNGSFGAGNQRKMGIVTNMNGSVPGSRRGSDEALPPSVFNLHPALSHSTSLNSTSSAGAYENPSAFHDVPERDY